MYVICHIGSDTYFVGRAKSYFKDTYFTIFASGIATYTKTINLFDAVPRSPDLPLMCFENIKDANSQLEAILKSDHILIVALEADDGSLRDHRLYEPIIKDEFMVVDLNLLPSQII